jgi:hypothetical protein
MEEGQLSQGVKIGKFKESHLIYKESWVLLKKDKEILIFPILSFFANLVSIVMIFVFFLFVFFAGDINRFGAATNSPNAVMISYLFTTYLSCIFITIFFQAGIISVVKSRLENIDASFGDGMASAFDKIGKIFIWSIVAATIGLILRMIAEKSKNMSKFIVFLIGASWSIATFFIAPVIIMENLSIKDSLKKSSSIINKTWGRVFVLNAGFDIYLILLVFLGVAIFIGSIYTSSLAIVTSTGVLVVLYFIVLAILSSTLSVVFKVVLYEYANNGSLPEDFSAEVVKMAFK